MAQWSVPELGFRPLVTIQRLVECSDGIELHRWGEGHAESLAPPAEQFV